MSEVEQQLDLLDGDLGERLKALNLERNIVDLSVRGYTVIEDAAPVEFFDQLREAILALIEEQPDQSRGDQKIAETDASAWMLAARGRVFEQALCSPKLVTLNEFMLGKGFQIYTCSGTLKRRGGKPLDLHTDYTAVRAPYPAYCQVFTSLWCCDDWTEAGGCTRVVPGSYRWRRPPSPAEQHTEAVPIECPKGSIIAWDGATWHGAVPRTTPGVRVGFHTPHSRLAVRPIDTYGDIPQETVDRNPPVFARMIGRLDPFGKTLPSGPDMEGLARMREWIDT